MFPQHQCFISLVLKKDEKETEKREGKEGRKKGKKEGRQERKKVEDRTYLFLLLKRKLVIVENFLEVEAAVCNTHTAFSWPASHLGRAIQSVIQQTSKDILILGNFETTHSGNPP